MPDARRHRGPHPEDAALFAPDACHALRSATADLSWLLTRGYASPSALKIVGDRYSLDARQRLGVMRSACSDEALERRQDHCVSEPASGAGPLLIDGYNVLTTVEAALAGGVILACRDQTYRDLASMHGTFRKVDETRPALRLMGRTLADVAPVPCTWYLDSPVSNSGRLKLAIEQAALEDGYPWSVQLTHNPDKVLWDSPHLIASADSAILDRCGRWLNLARRVVERHCPAAWVVSMAG